MLKHDQIIRVAARGRASNYTAHIQSIFNSHGQAMVLANGGASWMAIDAALSAIENGCPPTFVIFKRWGKADRDAGEAFGIEIPFRGGISAPAGAEASGANVLWIERETSIEDYFVDALHLIYAEQYPEVLLRVDHPKFILKMIDLALHCHNSTALRCQDMTLVHPQDYEQMVVSLVGCGTPVAQSGKYQEPDHNCLQVNGVPSLHRDAVNTRMRAGGRVRLAAEAEQLNNLFALLHDLHYNVFRVANFKKDRGGHYILEVGLRDRPDILFKRLPKSLHAREKDDLTCLTTLTRICMDWGGCSFVACPDDPYRVFNLATALVEAGFVEPFDKAIIEESESDGFRLRINLKSAIRVD